MSDLDFLKGVNKTITDQKSKEIGNFRIFTTFEQGNFVLNYKRKKDITTVQSTFTYIWGKDYTDNTNTLLSFNTTLDNINKPAEVTFGSLEPKKKKIEEESSLGKTYNSIFDFFRSEKDRKLKEEDQKDQEEIKQFINFSAFEQNITYRVSTQPLDKDTAKAIAQNWLIKHKDDFITATGEIFGNPFLIVGDVINVQGIGKMFGGKYFLTQVTHITNQNVGYVTKFTCKKIIKEQ